jgi:hypothetical protein
MLVKRATLGRFPGFMLRTGDQFVLAFREPLPDGVYWWAVRSTFGAVVMQSPAMRFEVGPPELTTLVLARTVKAPASTKKAGRARLRVEGTRDATATLVIRRGRRTLRKSTFPFGLTQNGKAGSVIVDQPLRCSTPGRYTAKVTAIDRYGKTMTASVTWTVSRARCQRLARAQARKRHAASKDTAAVSAFSQGSRA